MRVFWILAVMLLAHSLGLCAMHLAKVLTALVFSNNAMYLHSPCPLSALVSSNTSTGE